MRSIEAALRGAAIFAHLNDRQIARLAGLATLQEFAAAARIVRRGDSGMALYVIVRGRVLVTVDSEQDATVKRLGELGPGEVFGELALIDEGPRSADVTALEATECILLTRWHFADALRRDPQIARALLPVLCTRIRSLQERLMRYEAEATTD